MLPQKIYYREESPTIQAQNDITDERLLQCICQDPFANGLYAHYKNGWIDYEEMLIETIDKLFESKKALIQLLEKINYNNGMNGDQKQRGEHSEETR